MPKYKITSNYEYEIEAEDKTDAIEKWHENIEEELGAMNTTPAIKFAESLEAEEIEETEIHEKNLKIC